MNHWKRKRRNSDGEDDEKIISIEKTSADSAPLGNKIYFYTEVNKDSVLTLIRQIDDISKQLKLAQFTYNLHHPPALEIHICSEGGEVHPAIAVVDKIINSEIPVHTYCEGMVCSAATLISCAGHKRFITKSSCMLIHQVSTGMWGNYEQFKDELQNLNLTMELIKGVYLQKTKLDSTKLEEILTHDLYMKADECLKNGLVDVIL